MIIELNADIDREPKARLEEAARLVREGKTIATNKPLYGPGPNKLIVNGREAGTWGVETWWLPLSKKAGLKIYPDIGSFDMSIANTVMEKMRKDFESIAEKSDKYVPEVYCWMLVKHTGKFARKYYPKPEVGYEKNYYYPACLMKLYETTSFNTGNIPDIADEIYAYYLERGVDLHKDFRVGTQIGISNGNMVVLDIKDKALKKWL